MTTFYAICAMLGGTVLLCQFVLTLVGIDSGDEGDDLGRVGHSSFFFEILTFKAVVAAVTFFGLVGLAAGAGGMGGLTSLPVALAAGFAAMVGIALLMRGLHALKAEGTIRIKRAVGKTGTVYLTIPGNKGGVGKVTLNLQNRTAEYQAVTFQDQLPTGAKVVVVDIIGPDTVEVIAAPETGSMSHA